VSSAKAAADNGLEKNIVRPANVDAAAGDRCARHARS
jgi:hypothetical protein